MGKYNALTGQHSSDACLECEANTFNELTGQSGCKACASSASSGVGATSCSCIGKHRTFQESKQACVCKPYYEFYVGTAAVSDEDGKEDCQSIVFERCQTGYSRDASGNCVSKADGNCAQQCDGREGIYSVSLGTCECLDVEPLDEVCDENCRNSAPVMTYTESGIVVYDPSDTNKTTATQFISWDSIPGFFGVPTCPDASCGMLSMVAGGNGLGGTYDLPNTLDQLVVQSTSTLKRKEERKSFLMGRREHRSFRSQAYGRGDGDNEGADVRGARNIKTLNINADTTINPAIMCLELNEAVFFDVSSGSVPTYDKDNLLNTNDNFDFGYFKEIASAAVNSSSLQVFVFSFTEPGIYVLVDSADAAKYTVLKVTKSSESCPSDSRIVPFTLSNLVMMGVEREDDLVVSPDWFLIGMMLCLIAVMFIMIVAGIYYFQQHTWGQSRPHYAAYKDTALDPDLDLWQFYSSGTIPTMGSLTKGLRHLNELGGDSFFSEGDSGEGDSFDDMQAEGKTNAAPKKKKKKVEAPAYLPDADKDLGDKGPQFGDEFMNELSDNFDFEGFDFNALYRMMDETKSKMDGFIGKTNENLTSFYDRLSLETEHIKTVLAVKMHVQLNLSQEGFEDAIEDLVSGELLARQAYVDLSRRKHELFKKTLKELDSQIRNISDIDYNVFPVKELVRNVGAQIESMRKNSKQERKRRQTFASHVQIVGRPIIDALENIDREEAALQDDYLGAVTYFNKSINVELEVCLKMEDVFATEMEKLQHSSLKKRTRVTDEYHLNLLKQVKAIMVQIHYLDERLHPIMRNIYREDAKIRDVWTTVQTGMLEHRWLEVKHPTDGRLFRGINPDLAKVLAGLLGMRDGIEVDPVTGAYHAKTPFDPTDPFAAIEDPFPVEEEEEEESGDGKKKRKKKKKKKKGSGGGDDLYDLPDIPIGCDISEMTKHKDMALAQIEQDIEEIMADDSYDPEEREDLIQRMHEDKNAVLLAYKEDVINMVNIFEHDQLHAMSVEEADNAAVMEARNKLDEEFAELEAMKLKHEEEYKDLERTMDQEMRAEEELIELGGLDKLADLSEFGAQMGEYEIDMAELEQLSLPERAEKVKAIRREKRLKMKKKKLAELRTKHQKQLLLAERRMKNKKAGLDKQLEHQEQVKKLVTQAVEEAKEKIILQVSAMENDPSQANDFIRQEQNTHGEKLEVIKQHVLSLRLAAQSKLTAMEEFEYARMDVLMEKKQSSALLPQQKEVDELSRRLQDLIKIPPALRSGDENEGRLMVMIKQATADRDKIAQMLEIEKKSSVHGVQKKLENMKKISDMTVESEASMAIRKEEVRHEFNLRFERLALESKIIADALEALEPKDRRAAAKNMIELVLRPRHNKEMQSQLNDHFQERNVRFQKLIAAAEDGYDSKELRGKVNNEYDDRHATESSTLNNRQKEDIKAIFQKIYSDETFEGKEWQVGDGEDALAEFHRKRRKVADQQLNKEMEEHEKEFKEKAAQQAREHDARLKQDQEEFERMVAEADKRAHDRMVKRREMEDALKLAEIEEMQGLGMKEREDIMNQHRENMLRYEEALNSERVRQRQNFIKNLATMRERRARVLEKVRGAEEKKLREEKKKKLAELQRQREERRKERAQREKEMKSKLMSKKDQEVAAQVERWKKQQERTALAMLGISTSAGEGEGKEGEGKEGEAKAKAGEAKTGIDETNLTEAEKERLKVLMRLERIEEMITDIGDGAEQYREQAYVDAKDKSDPEYQAKSDSPVAMQPHEMSARVFVLYRFAMALIQTLVNANIISSPGGENQPIKLLVAQSIPENPHKSTAFRNSFFYMQLTNTLFIRHQRMQNVGEFVLVLLHSLAHINTSASNGEWDDRNPEFLRSFYQTLSLATGELFFARSEKALEMVGGEGEGQDGKSSSSSLASSAASLFGKITGRAKGSNSTRWQFSALLSQVKESGVDDLIDLHPISSQGVVAGDVMAGATNIEYFSSQRVFKRLEEYTEFKRSVDLRSHLEELEGASKMRDQSREKNQRDTFTRHNLKGAKAQRLRALEKDVWKSMAPRDGPVDRFVLENINDRINKEVVGVVEEICKASTKLHELETQRDSLVLGMQGDGGDSNDEGAAAKADATSAVSSTELAGVEEAIVRQHQIIGRLASEKDVLVQRLRNVQEAVSELSGE